jgi:mannose-6-phosphate isomerase-like protein (cupin superfamily)
MRHPSTRLQLAHSLGRNLKRIVVKPGGRLSLQTHHLRAEHRIVVRGTARGRSGTRPRSCTKTNRPTSRSVPGTVWRTPGKIDLELIEVQTGSYLGEDDIVRIEDDYRSWLPSLRKFAGVPAKRLEKPRA